MLRREVERIRQLYPCDGKFRTFGQLFGHLCLLAGVKILSNFLLFGKNDVSLQSNSERLRLKRLMELK